ncbi:ATP-binding protein [bacterium]|nr:ATP-binding protein [bacterium]
MGKFKLTNISDFNEIKVGDYLDESDYATITQNNKFLQFKYEDDKKLKKTVVTPGIFLIVQEPDTKLKETQFSKENLLDKFLYVEEVESKLNSFFSKLDVYKKFGIDVPRRNMLLYGPPGSGKSTAIKKVANKYNEDGKTLIVIYPTDKVEAYDVKQFVKTFEYHGVEKLIIIAEDIGGVEIDEVRMKSDSSLLSFLDNQEKSFKIPTAIIATTNFPEVFLGNLTNRPGRFDDKIRVDFPNSESRKELFNFFSGQFGQKLDEESEIIGSKKCSDFTPAHIREVIIRAAIHEKPVRTVIDEIIKEIEEYKNAFQNKAKMGINMAMYE